MPLNEVITISTDLEEEAWKVASKLKGQKETLVPLEGRRLVSYDDITKECRDLGFRLVKAIVCTRKTTTTHITNCIEEEGHQKHATTKRKGNCGGRQISSA